MRHVKKEPPTKKRKAQATKKKKPEKIEFAEWMDQDDVGEDLKGWTPTGKVELSKFNGEITGEDRPEWTQGEDRYMKQKKEHLPLNED